MIIYDKMGRISGNFPSTKEETIEQMIYEQKMKMMAGRN